MAKPTFETRLSPNRSRRSKPISAIVIHYTGSLSIDGTVNWFLKPESRVSAHYVVGRDGRVIQMVPDEDVAWHAGRSAMRPNLPNGDPLQEPNVNSFSIGIELVGTADSGFTDRQLASLYALIETLVARYKIPPERVVGHCHIAPGRKIDPDGYGQQFNWAKTRQVADSTYRAVTGLKDVSASPSGSGA